MINVFNDTAAFTTDGTVVEASKFVGATQIWQNGLAADVTELAATTTAGFRNTDQALNVTAAAGVASASVALASVAEGNALNVSGDALNSVTVAGSVADSDEDETVDDISLNVTVGEDEQTLTVNTAVASTLTFDDSASAADAKVTAIDASGSTGDVAFAGDVDVSSLQTGSGDDAVTLNTTFSATVTSASVTTGEGDDVITLNTTNDGDVSANAGAGDDTVIATTLGDISTGSVIDGGEGTDTLSTDGGTLAAEDYTLLNNVFTNFEELVFTKTSDFDASRLSDYTSFTLEAASTVKNVADDQALTTAANLTATAEGYVADTNGDGTADDPTYAGNLDVTANADATVTANASSVDLTVNATAAAANSSTLEGDVETASISVNNYVEEDDSAAFKAADVTVATNDTTSVLDALTSLTLSGDGAANVTNGVDTDLVTVDASELNTTDANGDAATGLTYTSNNAAAETISLGDGVDALTMNASTVENTDSITGFNLAEDDAGNYAGDTLSFGTNVDASGSVAFEQLGEVEANSLDLALVDVASSITTGADNAAIFDFGGDSYLFQDSGTVGTVDDGDALLQLMGGVDQQMFVDNAIA